VNNRKRVNFDIGRQFGIGMNISMRMNHGINKKPLPGGGGRQS
jgi:bifunctional pyridoxal-dependent enzyme with beta-cystathionase and maltose regulon repressor activities